MEVAYVACAHQIRIAQVRLQLNSSAETVKIIGHVSSCLVWIRSTCGSTRNITHTPAVWCFTVTCTAKKRVTANQSHLQGRILKTMFPQLSGKEVLARGQPIHRLHHCWSHLVKGRPDYWWNTQANPPHYERVRRAEMSTSTKVLLWISCRIGPPRYHICTCCWAITGLQIGVMITPNNK
jgi:hypothetical protein